MWLFNNINIFNNFIFTYYLHNNQFYWDYLFTKFFKSPIAIIVNSINFKKEIDKKFDINSTFIYNPLNKKEIINKSTEKINKSIYKNKKSLKLISIARFTDQKDHMTLLKAFEVISKKITCELLLIGYGINKAKIQNFISENKLESKIKILNYQTNPFKARTPPLILKFLSK